MKTIYKAIVIASFAAGFMFAGCLSQSVSPRNASLKAHGGPLVQAHRGGRCEWDDNALGGFRTCLEKGIRGFETDIRFSRDHKLVIMHDAKVDRTTDGHGVVEEMSADEICRCRLRKSSELVPTLEDVLGLFGGRDDVFIELEMKVGPSDFYTPAVLEEYCRELDATTRRMMAPGTYAFTCFSTDTLAAMRRVNPSAPLGFIVGNGLDDSHLAIAKALGCCSVAPSGHATTKEMVDKAHAAGFTVCLWMCQSEKDLKEYAEKGADRVTSDFPVRISQCASSAAK